MGKKILYTSFEDTESIIETFLSSDEMKKAIKRKTLYNFWDKVVDAKFKDKSKPYSMMGGGVMVIACANSVVAQELTLRKFQIMEKFKPYLSSLNMNIKDMRFDIKKWEEL